MSAEIPPTEAEPFCRWVLPQVSRTFAINIELLDESLRGTVRTAYLLCRAADTVEDAWPGSPTEIRGRFQLFLSALDGDKAALGTLEAETRRLSSQGADMGLLTRLSLVLDCLAGRSPEEQAIVRRAVRTMAEGMSRYSSRSAERGPETPYLDDEAELHDYCWIVAGCVGVMLTELFHQKRAGESDEVRTRRLALAPKVGEALQLTNILLDWPSDVRRGRCYLPAAWLARLGLTVQDLVREDVTASAELAVRLEALAHGALDQVAEYLETIPVRHLRYRLFCLWPALWARASLRVARQDARFPASPNRPKLSRGQLLGSAAGSLLVVYRHDAVRSLLARR